MSALSRPAAPDAAPSIPSVPPAIEAKLVAIAEIARMSPALAARVEAALARCLAGLLAGEAPPTSPAQLVRALIRMQRARERIFGTAIFRDPAWDMLLDLHAQREAGGDTSVTALCLAAGIPATTGLRYIAELEALGFVTRRRDAEDKRRIFIDPDPGAMAGVERAVRLLVAPG